MRTSAAVVVAGLVLLSGPTALATGHADTAQEDAASGFEEPRPSWVPVLGIAVLLLFSSAGLVLGWRWALQDLRDRIYRSRLVVFEVVAYRRAARPDSRPAIATGSHVGPKGGA